MLRQFALNRLGKLFWAASFIAAPISSLGASEVSANLSTDTRGVFAFIEGRFAPISRSSGSQNSSASGSPPSSGTSSQRLRDTRSFELLPTHSLAYYHLISDNGNFVYGVRTHISRTKLQLKYPNGVILSSSPPVIRFSEPVRFDLSSIDAGFGPFIKYQVSPRISVQASLFAVRQKIKLKSKLGQWDLEDTFYRSFFEKTASVEFSPFLDNSIISPTLYSAVSRINGANEFVLGARLLNYHW